MSQDQKLTETARSFEETARSIFGSTDETSIQRWIRYWQESERRNRELLQNFQQLALMDFTERRVLDIGCGTGGMSVLLSGRARLYVGADYHSHVLRLAAAARSGPFVQCSGTHLPFADSSFDYVMAFDVIEHLVGGLPWQLEFLRELRRVTVPLGMILLTTPNRLYPYDAHTQLRGPQFLPVSLANRYIRWKNPGFLREHRTFAEIQMLTPGKLRRLLGQSGLRFLHDLPCGLDREDYPAHFPFRSLLPYLGLGWYPHAEFWGVLVHEERRAELRLKLPKNWYYEQKQPGNGEWGDFQSRIDFDQGPFNKQLGEGWFWHERDQQGFRWTRREAVCFLETSSSCSFLEIEGFSPKFNRLMAYVNRRLVGEHEIEELSDFSVRFLVPEEVHGREIVEVRIRCRQTFTPTDPTDDRDLGLMIFAMRLTP